MKSILVTGASSGIGAAVATRFLQEGWRVGMLARRADALQALADGFDHAVVLPADVTDDAMLRQAAEASGSLVPLMDMVSRAALPAWAPVSNGVRRVFSLASSVWEAAPSSI